MNEQEMRELARALGEVSGPDGNPLFGGIWDQCPGDAADGTHAATCQCGGNGMIATLDLNRWLVAIGTDSEFHLLPTDQWVCTIPQTSSRSGYQPTPVAALLDAVQQAVRGL